MESPTGPVEVVIADTFRITGRGVAALLAGDPKPWWSIGTHNVRVVRPDGVASEARASVELALRSFGRDGEAMVLLFPHTTKEELPAGSHVTSLGAIAVRRRSGPPKRRWWQVWRHDA